MTAPLPLEGALRTLGAAGSRGLLLAASRDPDAKLTVLLTTPSGVHAAGGLVCKIPTTETAREAVRREGRALVALRRTSLGRLTATIPRYVPSGSAGTGPRPVEMLVSTHVPGRPMSLGYHRWRHTSRRSTVVADLDPAMAWLRTLWAETASDRAPLTWAQEVADELSARWDGNDRLLEPALERLGAAHAAMAPYLSPVTTVHGDYWCGNVLVHEGSVTGVVDWESGDEHGWPLRDATRFLLSYSLYLDRHTRPGRPVPGHRGLRRADNGSTLPYALLGHGWFPDLVRSRLAGALVDLGLPPHLWYDAALTGLGEIAARANHEQFGRDHLQVLATLPPRPGRPRKARS